MIEIAAFLAFVFAGLWLLHVKWRLDEQQHEIDALRDRLDAIRESRPAAPVPEAAEPRPAPPPPVSAPAVAPPVSPRHVAAPAAPKSVAPSPVEPAPVLLAQLPPLEYSHASEESLETVIGSRWLLYIGVAAIVIGAAYFEKLAFENHWVSETARVIQGGLAGLALIYAGIRFRRAGFAAYGQMISGCGAAILYVSTYAAFNFYQLIDRPIAFALMIAITAGTAWLADAQRAQGLAVLAVGGGFATPFMLPGTTDAQIALFGYDAVLIAGTVVLSRRRDWPLLDIVSYIFTLFTVAAWASHFYTPDKYLRTEIFLTIFCSMFVAVLYAHRATRSPGAVVARLILWTAPAAYYLASLIILVDHPTAMLVWLVGVALVSAILTAAIDVSVGFGVWFTAALPLLLWCATHLTPPWTSPGLIVVTTMYVITLAAQLYRESEREAFTIADAAWLHLNALVTFAAAYLLVDAVQASANGAVAAGFAVWNGAIASVLMSRHHDRALHFGGVAFTLLMIAIGLQFNGAALTIGWAAEGAIVVALGLREHRDWIRAGGVALFLVAIGRTADLLAAAPPLDQVPLLNARTACAAFVIALCYTLAWLHHAREDSTERNVHVAAGLVAAQLVTVMLITSEIDAYWAARADALTRGLATSVAWAVFATLLIVIGLRRDYAPIRYFAILLFAVTIAKVFFVDMAHLERVYRILSVIGLGIALLVTSYLYQRSRKPIDDLNGRR